MSLKSRDELLVELAELEAANEAATSWGAAVGARHERIKQIQSTLRHPPFETSEPRQLHELSDAEYDAFTKALGAGRPPTQKLIDLMRSSPPRAVKMYADALDAANARIAELEARAWPVAQASLGHSALIPTPEQIEPILDDFLGFNGHQYPDLRRRCAQRIFDLCAVMSGIPITPSDNRVAGGSEIPSAQCAIPVCTCRPGPCRFPNCDLVNCQCGPLSFSSAECK